VACPHDLAITCNADLELQTRFGRIYLHSDFFKDIVGTLFIIKFGLAVHLSPFTHEALPAFREGLGEVLELDRPPLGDLAKEVIQSSRTAGGNCNRSIAVLATIESWCHNELKGTGIALLLKCCIRFVNHRSVDLN
jgi:hypothetical protein